MSIFPSHDLSLNRYYYTFYSYHPNTPDVLNCLVYDQDQTLVETQDISFNGKTMSEMMAFVENSNANPYAIGKAETDYRSMDLTFGTVYKKSFQEKQRQKLMTYLNGNYKNVHGTSRSVFTVSASGGKYYVGGYTDPAPDLWATSEGYYVFDQSDSTNVSLPLVLSTQDRSSTYYSSMFTEGTQGSLNGYTIVDISTGTPDLHYYCTAHSGMGGQLLNFGSAIPYTVSVVYNDTYGQEIYQVAELANYYTDTSGIYLNTGSKYAIDLSLLNEFKPVIGTTNDISSSIISDTSIVNRVGDILYVRPIMSNLYLFDQKVALMAKPLEDGYYVKTVQNWTGASVFTLMAPTESTGIIQPDLSFNTGDVVSFHVRHSSMDNFNLVFGTSVDDSATTLDSNYVSRSGDIITLDLAGYSGGAVYYFEDSSANMGYVTVSNGNFLNLYPVTVYNGNFYIDNGSGSQYKPEITFTDGETYIFDQSDESNDGYPIVFGVTRDYTPYYTRGVTVVGTPGQAGAYTRIDYTDSTALFYFSSGGFDMGYRTTPPNISDVTDQLFFHTNATKNKINGSSFTDSVNVTDDSTLIYGTVSNEIIGGRHCYIVPKTGAAIVLPASLPTNSCTFSGYFYRTFDTLGNWTRLVGFHTTIAYHSVQIGRNSVDTSTEEIKVYDISNNNMYTGNPIPVYDKWIHFCITYYNNGSDSSGNIYINGVKETTYSNSTLDIEQYIIGGYGNLSNPGKYAGFYLNDVRVYNKVLSDSEVSSLYDYISY